MNFIERFGARAIAAVIALLFLLGLISFALWQWQHRRSEAAQSRVERSQHEAQSNSAADAIATVRASGEAETASEELTRTNEKEIRNADGANDPVNPSARDAGLRSLCRRPAYRDSERCRLFKAPAR